MQGCSTKGYFFDGLKDGEKKTLFIPGCSFVAGSTVRGDLTIKYKTSSGITHERKGKLITGVNSDATRYKHINFQTSTGPAVVGYQRDSGDVYTVARGYGWLTDLTLNTRVRGENPDPVLDSLIFRTNTGTATWQIDLQNGDYSVSIGSGDSSPLFPQLHFVTIEGVNFLNGVPTSPSSFVFVNDKKVTVSDGKLTMQIGGIGSVSTTVNFINIRLG